jgi:hypothetical protein
MSKEKSNISNGPIHKFNYYWKPRCTTTSSPVANTLPPPPNKQTNKQNETEHNKYNLGKQNLNIKHFSYKNTSCPRV